MKNPVKKYLFTPGPAPVPPEVLLEMARPMIHHRTPEFSAVLDQARERMRPLFGTRQEVVLLAASGTGAMEAAVINLLAPGEHAVYINGGKFGERWGKLLAAYGMTGHEIRVEWGRAVRPEQVEEALRANPAARAVLMQASETSTCAVHPVAEIAAITRTRDAMLIVDGITSVGVFEQKMDEWGVDALVTGSQKALMLPPGLAMSALSKRALERAEHSRTPRFYFDLDARAQGPARRAYHGLDGGRLAGVGAQQVARDDSCRRIAAGLRAPSLDGARRRARPRRLWAWPCSRPTIPHRA